MNKRWKYIILSHLLNSEGNYFLSSTGWHNFEKKSLVLFQRIPTCKQTFVQLFVFWKFDILFQGTIWEKKSYETVISNVSHFIFSILHNGYPERLLCAEGILIFLTHKNIMTKKIDLRHSMSYWLFINNFCDLTGVHS